MNLPRQPSASRGPIRNSGLCAIGFLAAVLLVRLGVPWEPFIPSYTDTLEFYRDRADRVTILFLGSSRVRAHVVPRIVDKILSSHGRRHRSFNIGVNALSLIELNTLVDEILRTRPSALRYVLMEPVYSTSLPAANRLTERAIYFHDLRNTALEIQCNLGLPAMRSTVVRSALTAGNNMLNVGRLTTPYVPVRADAEAVSLDSLREGRGYWPQESASSEELDRWRADFLEELDIFAVKMKEGRSFASVKRFDLPCQFEAIRAMARRLRDAGIQPVFLNTPEFLWLGAPLSFEAYLEEKGDPTPMLSYIRGHDDLYDPALWYDHRHLTGGGASLFSERLGRDLMPMVIGVSGS